MKIDLGNSQYKQFVSFANRAKDSDIVQVGEEGTDLRPNELAHRKIVAKSSWTFVPQSTWRGRTRSTRMNLSRFRTTRLKMRNR